MAQSAFTIDPPVPGVRTGQAMIVNLEASCVTHVGLSYEIERSSSAFRVCSPREELTVVTKRMSSCDESLVIPGNQPSYEKVVGWNRFPERCELSDGT